MSRLAALILGAALLSACAGQPAATPTSALPTGGLPSSADLCALLGTADWAALGYSAAAQPAISSDGPGSAYCTYTGTAGAAGGLELDAFVDATAQDAMGTFETITGEMSGGQSATLPSADQVLINPAVGGTYGAIIARAGRFTFTISLPTGAQAQSQLLALAAIVLARAQAWR